MTPSSSADPARWQALRERLDRLLDLPAAEREAALADPSLDADTAAELRALVAHALEATADPGFLRQPVMDATIDSGAPGRAGDAPDRRGQRLGPWEITERLGAGGMGEVWAARRADGHYEGEAAIKLLRRGMDSAAVLARFAQEQQVLARLAHPHIAHLLDAGLTADGLPYFVMERVVGRPIDQACEGRPLEERLALFLQLTDAVAHAHRHLLVHRDLKPGNVLVTDDGRVKLLDFGIAKALTPEGDAAALTQQGHDLFTPHYASPEQVRGEPVSTATDIYSLGVLLYVLLTGQRPYGRSATSPFEAARAVLEEDPTRPSHLKPPQPGWERTRRRLQGDLDNILLKALAKPVDQRYASVEALAADVRAHLSGHPVSARAASPGYLLSRFVQRHRIGTAVGALALASVVTAAGVALWQARVADAQRDAAQQRFRQVRQLANQLVFKYHDQIATLPAATKVREALLTDAAGFLDSLQDGTPDDPQLAYEVASTYYRISSLQGVDLSINTGQYPEAEANMAKALAATKRYVEAPGMTTEAIGVAINMHVSHGELWQRRGEMRRAEAALREGLPLLERMLKDKPRDTWALASAISLYGVLARIQGNNLANATLGQWRAACDSADRAREAAETTLAADPKNAYAPDSLAFTLGEQGQCKLLAGRADEAVALFERQVGLRDQMHRKFPDDMDFRYQRAVARGNLAAALSAQGQHAPARRQHDEAMNLVREAARGDTGNQAAQARIDALAVIGARLALNAGDAAAAAAEAEALLERLPVKPGDGFGEARRRADALLLAARGRRAQDPARALAHAEAAAALMQPARADDDNVTRRWMLAQALGEQAQARAQRGEAAAAAEAARQALALWRATPPTEGPPPALQRWIEPLKGLAGA